jgi:hypothetical protein
VRRVLFWAIAVFTLATVQSFALQTHPHVRFPGFGHARKVEAPPKIEQDTANTDTSTLGSPLVLDKGWRQTPLLTTPTGRFAMAKALSPM